ncbi:fructose-6-phosphate aldolase [Clostridium isatidis]|uniref:Fructose-6-phosphate aldolase n=1 Tax=Clostridium isatidis TaxID=182773 RepID=A0A343J9X1_9CLOT|nr:fructose-6-phosphate aldolase [Clostridium isatidis]ASW42329.1 fructose-6-phosphate aldolase [Clostridium isatidis]
MKFLIDDVNIEKIRDIYDKFPIDGITSNPSILSRYGKQPYKVLKEIREFIGEEAELHVQVISEKAEGMIVEAYKIVQELGENTYIKIPVTREGLKAIKILSKENINITATAIYTQMQGYLAGKAGAKYAAPYVNRIDNLGADGIKTAKEIHDIYKNNNINTQVLAASFKNSQQVLELCRYGIGAATIAPEVIEGLIKNPTVDMAVKAFKDDFEKLCGEEKSMLNCK